MSESATTELQRLLAIMQRLRDPEQGCPWDNKQTFTTLGAYTLEETYEVLDAIERQDFNDLRDELGDLLFQVVFYAEMGQEKGHFDFAAICRAISDKLERRHPQLFLPAGEADKPLSSASVALAQWETLKSQERSAKAMTSALDDIPVSLPALMKADKIQRRCAAVGFDWHTLGPVVAKVYEEIDEVMDEARQTVVDAEHLAEELGDLLFATVNLTRHLGYKAEAVLQAANRKFEHRFRAVENAVAASGKTLQDVTLADMEQHWQQIKQQEQQT